jgi:hypothetical protein
MQPSFLRRSFLRFAPLGALAASKAPAAVGVPDVFPQQSPAMVREMVTVSHGNKKRVRELVEAHPALAKAAVDWGFGDWETALGAASHTGNREIAELLISHGARPSLFSAAMLGQLDGVKAFVAAQPGAQRIPGPHGIGLLAHAKAGGAKAEAVLRYLEELGDAGAPKAVTLMEEDLAALPGTYVYGEGAAERIEISAAKGLLTFTRAGTIGRGLNHLGDRVFSPAGAEAVRVKFETEKDGVMLAVLDGEVVLRARRVS